MSGGDLQRKENKQRMIRLKMEQEALEGITFSPEITRYAKQGGKKSKLQLSTDSCIFLEQYHRDREKKDEKIRDELMDRRERELEGCTFQPTTRECPQYVKRIAKSMAIVRAARAEAVPETASKPQWK